MSLLSTLTFCTLHHSYLTRFHNMRALWIWTSMEFLSFFLQFFLLFIRIEENCTQQRNRCANTKETNLKRTMTNYE